MKIGKFFFMKRNQKYEKVKNKKVPRSVEKSSRPAIEDGRRQ